jgi:hypothetical protein
MNDKVEYIELACDANLREIEIVVNVPFNGKLTKCYALGIYDDNGLRTLRVTTWDTYEVIHDEEHGSMDSRLDADTAEQIEELLNKQL